MLVGVKNHHTTSIEQAHLKHIINLQNIFGISIGLSDHAIGDTAAIADGALGACAIEKHFTINGNKTGPDSEFSIEPNEHKELVRESKNA